MNDFIERRFWGYNKTAEEIQKLSGKEIQKLSAFEHVSHGKKHFAINSRLPWYGDAKIFCFDEYLR